MEKLHEIQSSTKCLVVLDDMWRNEHWDCLKSAFPTQSFESKLMLTSRNVQLSHHVDPNAFLHQPRLLDDEQSWDLLRMKAAPRMDPRDVEKKEKFGKEMVRHCGGLPFSIVTLGGILVTKETWMEWEMVHKDVHSSIRSTGKGIGDELQRAVQMILVKSYNDLPYQLKPCFLYLGRFGEDVEIEAEKLYQLWIAEGFILSSDRRVEGETLMEVAESYLAELVHKCMVQVKFEEEESSLRKFGSFVLHDLMRNLALSKAKEEDCFNVLDLRQDNAAKLNGDMHLAETTRTRRLDIYFDGGDVISSNNIRLVKKSGRCLRSVLWFNEGKWSMEHLPPIVRLKLANFRFLRVLSFEGLNLEWYMKHRFCGTMTCCIWNYVMKDMFSEVLRNLIHLRYLSLRNTHVEYFPSAIENLEQLQTLDLRVIFLYLLDLPWASNDKMRMMGQLRHLYLPPYYGYKFNKKIGLEGLSKLETLENFRSKWCQIQELHKLNNLRKLKMKTRGGDEWEETMQYLESKASSCLRYISLVIVINWSNFQKD